MTHLSRLLTVVLCILCCSPIYADAPVYSKYGVTAVNLCGGYINNWGTQLPFTDQGDGVWVLKNFELEGTVKSYYDIEPKVTVNSTTSDWKLASASSLVIGTTYNYAPTNSGGDLSVPHDLSGTYDVTMTFTSSSSATLVFTEATGGGGNGGGGNGGEEGGGEDPTPTTPPTPTPSTLSTTLPDALVAHAQSGGSYVPVEDLTMWFKGGEALATQKWPIEANSILIGNGQMGGMVFGDAGHKIIFSDKTIFTGGIQTGTNYTFKGFGSLTMTPTSSATSNIVHQLDMTTGVYSFVGKRSDNKVEGVEWIASYPDQIFACKISGSEAGMLSYKFLLASEIGGSVALSTTSTYGELSYATAVESSLVLAACTVRIIPDGGSVSIDGSEIKVTNANSILVLLSGVTNYDSSNSTMLSSVVPATEAASRISAAAAKGWDALHADHVADHSSLFNRMIVKFDGQRNDMSTQEMIDNYDTASSPRKRMIENLVFAYGRYLEIAASRAKSGGKGVDCPSNLQGVWNQSYADWYGDIHGNINVNMNYWPSEITNLSETHLALNNWLMNLSGYTYWSSTLPGNFHTGGIYSGGSTTGNNTGISDGWTCHFAMNPFGGGYEYIGNYNTAQAWFCHHIIQHYLYTLDDSYRTRMMPVLWKACRFWKQYLRKTMVSSTDYIYETQPEYDPEIRVTGYGTPHTQQMLMFLFKYTTEIAQKHGAPACAQGNELNDFIDIYQHLDNGLHVTSGGMLREDKDTDGRFGEEFHRHLSHLTCMYPLGQVHYGDEMMTAAENALIDRGAVRYGVTDVAVWTIAWKSCCWAQARNSANAFGNYQLAFKRATHGTNEGGLYANLFSSNKGTKQIDGNYGLTAAMAEMLLQSNRSEVTSANPYTYIDIAPALPIDVWTGGEVNGIKAQGNYEVSYKWDATGVYEITIKACGNSRLPFYVYYPALCSDNYYVSNIVGINGDMEDMRTSLSDTELSTLYGAGALTSNDHLWKFVPSAIGASVTIVRGSGSTEIEQPVDYLPYTSVVSSGNDGILTLTETDGTDVEELMHVMFGSAPTYYYNGSSFSQAGISWETVANDGTMPEDIDNITGYAHAVPAADRMSVWAYTEVNGQPSDCNITDYGLFLTPVAGCFYRFEPEADGVVTAMLRHNGTAHVMNEDGCDLSIQTTVVGDMKKHSFTAEAGRSYYLYVPGHTPDFVAADFAKDNNYAPVSITINGGNNDDNSFSSLTVGDAVDVTYNREFARGCAYPIVLPFSVSETQMRRLFGDDVKVLYLNPLLGSMADTGHTYLTAIDPAIKDISLTFTCHHYQMLYAGVPAIVLPSKDVVGGLTINNVTYQGDNVRSYAISADGDYTVTGSYNARNVTDEVYYLTNYDGYGAVLHHSTSGQNMHPTRAWIERRSGATGHQLRIVGMQQSNYANVDTPSGISDLIVDHARVNADDPNVYNLLGIPVSDGPTDHLSPGIYISRGRKVMVK